MSLFSTMNTAASGLGVSSSSLSVIGDNIANLNTTGYKGSRAQFADYLPNNVVGLAGPSTIGTGAGLDTVVSLFGQGSIEDSDNALDMAISGNGFFVLSDGVSDYFSRAGQFYLNDSGEVVNAQGYNVQGYNATDGTLGATVEDMVIGTDPISPKSTSEVVLSAILSSEADNSDTPIASGTVDITSGSGDTLEDAADQADFATSVTTYDSLGQSHEVTVLFERSDADDQTWTYYAVVDAGELEDPTGTLEDGFAYQIAEGVMTFNTDGELTSVTQTDTTGWNYTGATEEVPTFDFGLDTAGDPTDGRIRMLGGDSAISAISQDGYPTGDLSSISVDPEGVVTGVYSSGQEITLGQVVLASFDAQNELAKIGNTLFRATEGSGDPAIGGPGTGSRGSVVGYALEKSNVDLEGEFVDMISSQRSYQANARMINSANDTLQELVNLV
jgi:flagellar hook protein FlgE